MQYVTLAKSTVSNPRLRMLNALRAGEKPITTFMGLPSFRTAQIVAQSGLDVSLEELCTHSTYMLLYRESSSIVSTAI